MAIQLEKIKYLGEFPRELPTQGQDWAQAINKNFTIIDEHNHEATKGIIIESVSLGSGKLDLKTYSIKKIWAFDFDSLDDTNVVPNKSLFVNQTNDLCYKNGDGNVLQLTKNAGLNPDILPKAFTVLSGQPLCSFEHFLNNFRFQDGLTPNLLKTVTSYSALFEEVKIQNEMVIQTLTVEDIYLPEAQKLCYISGSTFLLTKDLTHCLFKVNANNTYATLTKNNGLYLEAAGVTQDASYFKGARYFIAKDTPSQDSTPLGMKYQTEDFSFNLTNNEDTSEHEIASGFSEISDETGKLLVGVVPIFSPVTPTQNSIDSSSFRDPNVKNVFMKFSLENGILKVRNNFKFYNFPNLKLTYRIISSIRFKTEI